MTTNFHSESVIESNSTASAQQVREWVNDAAGVIAPVWPLSTFIAVNPLQGWETQPFEKAVREATRLRTLSNDGTAGRANVQREMIKWCTTFFDEGQAALPLPGREEGFYRAFAGLAIFDNHLKKHDIDLLSALPETAERAVLESLDQLGIPFNKRGEFLKQQLAALPGWAGYVLWHERWREPAEAAQTPATLVDFLAVQLILTRLLWPEATILNFPSEINPPLEPAVPLVDAEETYRSDLLRQLQDGESPQPKPATKTPLAQLVFCIDVRSEPMRRAIETQGAYETFGFAGFFGVPVQVNLPEEERSYASCPVLLKPRHQTCIHSTCGASQDRRRSWGRSIWSWPKKAIQSLKHHVGSPFALVEMLGPWLGLGLIGRTTMPRAFRDVSGAIHEAVVPTHTTRPTLDQISIDDQINYAESALRMMGLTGPFAPLVVLTGHGSTTTNNAFASALDCGACGGNQGGVNAQLLAEILNNETVRNALTQRNLVITPHTRFLAAQHDTTTDEVKLFLPADITLQQQKQVAQLQADLQAATRQNALQRCRAMGLSASTGDEALEHVRRRGADWAEVRPEWGLARNAAFIVAPRSRTRDHDLDGRCFLHSYDWASDSSGSFLTTILTAPMVVAQWINSHYLFATLDNGQYGGGSKVTQNVTGRMGVMQGNASDLRTGLPLQSVYATHDQPYHEPLRLLTVVEAPRTRITEIVQQQECLQRLFGNGWVTLTCLDPEDGQAYLMNCDFTWQLAS